MYVLEHGFDFDRSFRELFNWNENERLDKGFSIHKAQQASFCHWFI